MVMTSSQEGEDGVQIIVDSFVKEAVQRSISVSIETTAKNINPSTQTQSGAPLKKKRKKVVVVDDSVLTKILPQLLFDYM